MPQVIVVHHHDKIREVSLAALEQLGCQVSCFANAKTVAQQLIEEMPCDVIFLCLFVESSFQFLRYVERSFPTIPIIAMTVYDQEKRVIEQQAYGVTYVLSDY